MYMFSSSIDPSLKPMVESVSAQLKRGKAIGFSKAYVPKTEAAGAGGGEASGAPGRIKPVQTEQLFRRKPQGGAPEPSGPSGVGYSAAAQRAGADGGDFDPDMSPLAKRQANESRPKQTADGEVVEEDDAPKERPPDPNAIHLSGDYLTRYLEETNGDDSQFKDIDAAVIPFSTGTSPRRERPDEYLFREDYQQKKAAEAMQRETVIKKEDTIDFDYFIIGGYNRSAGDFGLNFCQARHLPYFLG